jgi:hypothetical protein
LPERGSAREAAPVIRAARPRVRAVLAIGAALFASTWFLVGTSTTANAAPQQVTFNYNGTDGSDGTVQEWEVPFGVTEVTIDAFGAQGGRSAYAACDQPQDAKPGGNGGETTATIAVHAGEVLYVVVGGAGLPGVTQCGSPGAGGEGGFNGGANGGTTGNSGAGGGGGGGASDVRLAHNDLTNRVVVAAGGGGGANDLQAGSNPSGGDGGGTTGEAGTPSAQCGAPAGGGGGGTPTDGGAAGSAGVGGGEAGIAGSFATGGSGGAKTEAAGGGGGGGGYYGGGGGGSGACAGGGGGGSSFSTDVSATFGRGVRPGNGVVTLTFDTGVGSPEPETPTGSPSPTTPPSAAPASAVGVAPRFTG